MDSTKQPVGEFQFFWQKFTPVEQRSQSTLEKDVKGRKARAAQIKALKLPEILPKNSCILCWNLDPSLFCRSEKVVSSQEVEFLRGCGITRAPEGQRRQPKPVRT